MINYILLFYVYMIMMSLAMFLIYETGVVNIMQQDARFLGNSAFMYKDAAGKSTVKSLVYTPHH